MRIDGKVISESIIQLLRSRTQSIKRKGVIPHLAIILVGNDPSSEIYVRRKEIVGKEIGAMVSTYKLSPQTAREDLFRLTQSQNIDTAVHGIIIQRPVPMKITKEELDNTVIKEKDIDGFRHDSPFNPPIGEAVLRILEWVHQEERLKDQRSKITLPEFQQWLKQKRILIIGRGETGGKPIAYTFTKGGIPFRIAHSQTVNLKKSCLASDIIISCVGKVNIVRHDMLTKRTILIGVGLHPEDDKLAPDYNQEEIKGVVAYYTPVPGGVGPVNVSCLFENLLRASTNSI